MTLNTNNSNFTRDYSPFWNNGTVNNSLWTTNGISGGAYLFNVINSSINISDDPSLSFGNGSFSVEAWFNASTISTGDQNLFFKFNYFYIQIYI